MSWLTEIVDEIAAHGAVVRVAVVRADGSTPREPGAAMLVTVHAVRGTIGGGALELAAIGHAREMLIASREAAATGFPSPLWGGVRGGGNPDIASSAIPPTLSLPHKGGGDVVARASPNFDRQLLWQRDVRDFPLGPSLGQCCGGYVRLLFELFTEAERGDLLALAQRCDDARALLLRPLAGGAPLWATADRKEHHPDWPLGVTRAVREMLSGARPRETALVRGGKRQPAWLVEPCALSRHALYLYGAGHVGRALVRVIEDLPFAVTWVDTSRGRFPESIPPHTTPEIARDPAAFAATAPGEAFHLVLTYSHALDLAICHRLLRRADFRFLGLIGSATKRARFVKRLTDLGIPEAQLARLVCPIGLPGLGGKEPAMIAVSVAAQLIGLAVAARRDTREAAAGPAEFASGAGKEAR
jgi:xanthine dehydrogenase accessory factor